MHVITRKRLLEFAKKHTNCAGALDSWYRIIKGTVFSSLADLRKTFPSADQVAKFTVFNIGGNKARLIAAIHYNRKKIYIRHVLTHSEYTRMKWRQ